MTNDEGPRTAKFRHSDFLILISESCRDKFFGPSLRRKLTKKNIKLMIIAGEASGDLHGGDLCRELIKLQPGLSLFGMGGEKMKDAGVELIQEISRTGVVGFWEVYKDLGHYRRIFKKMVAELDNHRPDGVILIDYPGFNIRFARQAHRRGIKVIYYISPQVWAWGAGRVRKLEQSVDKMLVIFDFEKEFYRDSSLPVEFVGHPLVDNFPADLSRGSASPGLKAKDRPWIGLLPGSRATELEKLLPLLVKTAALIRQELPTAEFVLPLASPSLEKIVLPYLSGLSFPIHLRIGRSREVLAAADLVIAASGTVTLEAAAAATPLIVVYKISLFSWLLARFLIKVPYISLVNLVGGEEIVPEYLQFQATPPRVARRVLRLFSHPEEREEMIKRLMEVRRKLGPPGAARRAAAAVLATLNPDSASAGLN